MIGSLRKLLSVPLLSLILGGAAPGQSQDRSSPPPPPETPTKPDTSLPSASAEVTPGRLIKRAAPVYPKKARKQKIEGVVFLKAKITTNGDVVDLSVVSGDPLLVPAAIDAVKQWKYSPYLLGGQPVEVDTEIRVNFQLAGK